jgi:hypothetical protein
MLAVAARTKPNAEWRQGDAASLPFEDIEVKGSPLADMLSDDAMQALAAESEDALAEFAVPSGEIVMPMDAHIVTASKGWISMEIDGRPEAARRRDRSRGRCGGQGRGSNRRPCGFQPGAAHPDPSARLA